jgi:hypothetical protein
VPAPGALSAPRVMMKLHAVEACEFDCEFSATDRFIDMLCAFLLSESRQRRPAGHLLLCEASNDTRL